MNISIIISISILLLIIISGTIYHSIIVKKFKENIKKLNSQITNLTSINENLNTQFKNFNCTGRFGYYYGTINLRSSEDEKNNKPGDPYSFIVYVKELDRYTNGMSKIELNNIEVISGYQISQYSWVKKSQRERFSSIKKTSEIEWLESEETIKESRKEKLAKILNNN